MGGVGYVIRLPPIFYMYMNPFAIFILTDYSVIAPDFCYSFCARSDSEGIDIFRASRKNVAEVMIITTHTI